MTVSELARAHVPPSGGEEGEGGDRADITRTGPPSLSHCRAGFFCLFLFVKHFTAPNV